MALDTCVLLMNDNEYLASEAETYAKSLFDVRYASRLPRSAISIDPKATEIVLGDTIDYLFNFLASPIVPKQVLDAIRIASINFHPAPPEYPGVGTASYALFNGDRSYGVTAHIMEPKVDCGRIIHVTRFPINEDDTCDDLHGRALEHALNLFHDILHQISTQGLSYSDEQWSGRKRSRKDFEEFMLLRPEDSEEINQRKIRAIRSRNFPGPYLEMYGHKFELPPKK